MPESHRPDAGKPNAPTCTTPRILFSHSHLNWKHETNDDHMRSKTGDGYLTWGHVARAITTMTFANPPPSSQDIMSARHRTGLLPLLVVFTYQYSFSIEAPDGGNPVKRPTVARC